MDRKTWALSLLSGILLFLSFPKFDYSYLAWISLVPLLFSLKGKRPSEAFTIGLVAGFVYNVGIIYWITFVVVHYGYLPPYLGILVMLMLALYLGLYVALFCTGVVFFEKKGIGAIIAAPVLWTSLEFMKSNFMTGFPWENLAYSQYKCIPLIQIADITGAYGITCLIVFINCVLYSLVKFQDKKKTFTELGIGIVLILLIISYGNYRIDKIERALTDIKPVKVSLIQGNIDQSVKWDPKYQAETLDTYKKLSRRAIESGPDLIIWPETAVPFFFQDIDDKHRLIVDFARKTDSYLLFGSPSYDKNEAGIYFLNSAYLVSPSGDIAGRYDKVHLVPFGEYVPLRSFLFFIEKLVAGAGDFLPGKEIEPLHMDKEKIGVLICYEGIFPEISRNCRRKGSNILVNITNDAWFGRTSAPYQHLTMTAFRAVENRLYVVRAANTGISAVIGPTGKIIFRTGLFERTTLNGSVKLVEYVTFYSRYGDIFAYGCIIILMLTFFISLKTRRMT